MYSVKVNCPAYNELHQWWLDENDPEKKAMYAQWVRDHRVSCPVCRRETAKLTAWAKDAQHPELEEATR